MAKKADLLNETNNSADVMGIVSAGGTNNTDNTQHIPHTKPNYYRFNLNMPAEYRKYLAKASYDASSPDHIVTITEYICDLIRQDMEKHSK